jgi:CDP-diacylglycerol---glycerol-3-phosphate 3-phosphatidyltransferase
MKDTRNGYKTIRDFKRLSYVEGLAPPVKTGTGQAQLLLTMGTLTLRPGMQYGNQAHAWVLAPCLLASGFSRRGTCGLKCRNAATCSATKPPPADSSERVSPKTTGFQAQLPMILTWARVAAVPALASVGLAPVFEGQRTALATCFMLASVTDWADGYLARRWKVCSAVGAFLDPVADKLMVAAALVLICVRFALSRAAPVIAVSAIVILTREIFVSALREWMASAIVGGRDIVQVGFAGKVKTTTQMIALSVLLAVKDPVSPFGLFGTLCLAVSAVMAVYSAIGYVNAALPTMRAM